MFGGMNVAVPSLADIAAVTRNNDGDGFGGNNGWWILIILFAIFGGWGNGYGNGNGGGQAVYDTGAGMQRGFDTSAIITKLDGINSGICSLGYDQLAQMNGINSNIMQTGFGLQQSINGLSTQLANCCCENRTGQMQIINQMDRDACAITTAINQMGQNIMQNDNANYRQLHDENVAMQMETLRQRIAEQQSLIQSLNLATSQANQNNYIDSRIENLYNRLNPCPEPCYVVPNPNCCPQPNFWTQPNNNCCGTQTRCCAA